MSFFSNFFSHSSFRTAVLNNYATVIAAVWVTDGIDRCIIGHVDPAAIKHAERLEGRLCQVTNFFLKSTSTAKNEYSSVHNGVIIAQIIDKYVPGDEVLNEYIDNIDSDLEDD